MSGGSATRAVSEAAERNKGPILDVLRGALPEAGTVLEVASGTGQHVAHLAAALPGLTFQPSDPDMGNHASIHAWCEGLANVRPPLAIDVTRARWGVAPVAAVLAVNLLHIAPWEATKGLFAGGAGLLAEGGLLYVYGPFSEAGMHLGPGNAAFDRDLRARDPALGVRDMAYVSDVARDAGFRVERVVAMPADNRSILYRRT